MKKKIVRRSEPGLTTWHFEEEIPTGAGSFVFGPTTPLLGIGSARMVVDGTGRLLLRTFVFSGTRFDQITTLKYNTYRAEGGAAFLPALQIDVDYDLTDSDGSWQGRLVFDPINRLRVPPQPVLPGVWQTWDALAGRWWASGGPGKIKFPNAAPGDLPTWAGVLAEFPNAGIRAPVGGFQLKAGGPWPPQFDGNVDSITIGINGVETTHIFEPELVSSPGVSHSTILPGKTLHIAHVKAASDDDEVVVISHALEAVPMEVALTPLSEKFYASRWHAVLIDKTHVVLKKDPAPGSGEATDQLKVMVSKIHSIVG